MTDGCAPAHPAKETGPMHRRNLTALLLGMLALLAAPVIAEEDAAVPAVEAVLVEAVQDDAMPQEEAVPEETAAPARILTLRDAQEAALRDNPSLKAAEARVTQARERQRQALAAYFPTVFANFSVGKTWLSENTLRAARNQAFGATLQQGIAGAGPSPGSPYPVLETVVDAGAALGRAMNARDAVDDSFSSYTYALSAQWTLFDGFAREYNRLAAKHNAREFGALHRETERLLLNAVAQAYYAAQLAREDTVIAGADEAFNLRQVTEARARRQAGTGSLSDELNFEVRANAARAAVIRARQVQEVALISLAELMALPGGAFPDDTALAPLDEAAVEHLPVPDAETLIAYAMENRPDLAQSRHALDRAGAIQKARRGAFLPTVTVSASKALRNAPEPGVGLDDLATTVGLDVSYVLFAGGGNLARYREARAARTEAEHTLSSTELEVTGDVRELTARLDAARNQLWLQRANAGFVERNRDLVEKEYRAGQTSLVRLNEAQRDLISAQASLASAKANLLQTWHNLLTAAGATIAKTPPEGMEDELAAP
jgi:outer membrane protein